MQCRGGELALYKTPTPNSSMTPLLFLFFFVSSEFPRQNGVQRPYVPLISCARASGSMWRCCVLCAHAHHSRGAAVWGSFLSAICVLRVVFSATAGKKRAALEVYLLLPSSLSVFSYDLCRGVVRSAEEEDPLEVRVCDSKCRD